MTDNRWCIAAKVREGSNRGRVQRRIEPPPEHFPVWHTNLATKKDLKHSNRTDAVERRREEAVERISGKRAGYALGLSFGDWLEYTAWKFPHNGNHSASVG